MCFQASPARCCQILSWPAVQPDPAFEASTPSPGLLPAVVQESSLKAHSFQKLPGLLDLAVLTIPKHFLQSPNIKTFRLQVSEVLCRNVLTQHLDLKGAEYAKTSSHEPPPLCALGSSLKSSTEWKWRAPALPAGASPFSVERAAAVLQAPRARGT